MRLHYLQHVWFEDLGVIKEWAEKHGIIVTRTAFFDNGSLPKIEDIDWLIVMGGPMGVYDNDEFPWLEEEKVFIRKAIKQNKKVLGICLGAQLIADVLGAKVTANACKEIGWFPVRLINKEKSPIFSSFRHEFNSFHWHGDTFAIPEGAARIAESEACANQAFSYNNGNVLGIQFHLEITFEGVNRLVELCKGELIDAKYVQSPKDMLIRSNSIKEMHENMYELLKTMKDLEK